MRSESATAIVGDLDEKRRAARNLARQTTFPAVADRRLGVRTPLGVLCLALVVACTAIRTGERPRDEDDGDISEPTLVADYLVPYPPDALDAGVYGVVRLSLRVEVDGGVDDVRILCGEHPGLNQAARDAVLRFRFRPAHADGGAIAKYVVWRYQFFLDSTPEEYVSPCSPFDAGR